MKNFFYAMFSFFICNRNAQETSYVIDMIETSKVQWKVGDIVSGYLISLDDDFYEIDRQFQGVTLQGFYLVQDFYQKEKKPFTKPFVLSNPQVFSWDWMDLMDIDPTPLCGDYLQYYLGGSKAVAITKTSSRVHQRKSWYANGQLKCQVNYVSGKMEGLFTFWGSNGRKIREGHMLHGIHVGLWLSWHENGQLATSEQYKNGILDGKWENWHENGSKFRKGECRNGKEVGMSYIWDKNGLLIEKKDHGE